MQRSAEVSPCGRYRYMLERRWGEAPPVTFIMLNPSTADAENDDPTIRRCIGFARAWNAGGILVVNLFALRSTDPAALAKDAAPIGPQNDEAICRAVLAASRTIAAWGAHAFAERRAATVKRIVTQSLARRLECLGKTKGGHPRHPLYVPAAQLVEPL